LEDLPIKVESTYACSLSASFRHTRRSVSFRGLGDDARSISFALSPFSLMQLIEEVQEITGSSGVANALKLEIFFWEGSLDRQ
jgi:hypothetical protein